MVAPHTKFKAHYISAHIHKCEVCWTPGEARVVVYRWSKQFVTRSSVIDGRGDNKG